MVGKSVFLQKFVPHIEVRRFLRGCVVAGVIFSVYMSCGLLLRYYLGLSELWSAFLAFSVTMPFSYFGHAIYTFQSLTFDVASIVRFSGSVVLTAAISWLVMNAGVKPHRVPFWIGLLIITMVVPMLNYLLLRLYVFGRALARDETYLDRF